MKRLWSFCHTLTNHDRGAHPSMAPGWMGGRRATNLGRCDGAYVLRCYMYDDALWSERKLWGGYSDSGRSCIDMVTDSMGRTYIAIHQVVADLKVYT